MNHRNYHAPQHDTIELVIAHTCNHRHPYTVKRSRHRLDAARHIASLEAQRCPQCQQEQERNNRWW